MKTRTNAITVITAATFTSACVSDLATPGLFPTNSKTKFFISHIDGKLCRIIRVQKQQIPFRNGEVCGVEATSSVKGYKKEAVSKENEASENRLNGYLSPSGTRIKRGCPALLRRPLFLTVLCSIVRSVYLPLKFDLPHSPLSPGSCLL